MHKKENEMGRTKWYGTLSVNNIKEVANMIYTVLKGRKYSFVDVYEYRRYEPETRLNQCLKNGSNGSPLSIYFDDDNKYAGFNFCDTYGIWGCTTNRHDEQYDPEFNNPYIVIEDDQVTITQRTPEGRMCYWQMMVNYE
jgi:hypothetical protein